jgi:lipoate synthase
MKEIIALLKSAKCPNTPYCDNEGTTRFPTEGGEYEIESCQWCHERQAILHKLDKEPKNDSLFQSFKNLTFKP